MSHIKYCKVVFSLLFVTCFNAQASKNNEVTVLELNERVYGTTEVPIETFYPAETERSVPVIISQHGSERDGRSFTGGKGQTDEFTTRLINQATQNGYAVIALDAFYKKGIKASDKRKFPKAAEYARQIRDLVHKNPKLDSNNIFYTGFSYGGGEVLDELYRAYSISKWNAIAAAEPGCNTFAEPQQLPTPILILKGDESHYPPKPCFTLAKLYNEEGNKVEVISYP